MQHVHARVECPNVAEVDDYPPIEIPGGRIIAWNQKPGTTEKFLVFIVLWNGRTMESFRKNIYKPKTLADLRETRGYFWGNISQNELDAAIKKGKLFPYKPPETKSVSKQEKKAA